MEDILLQIQRPGQYIGGEWNVSRKDFDKADIKFALCFPDLYEIGMSNLGFRIIYSLLNAVPDIACERFFSPGLDFEAVLRNTGAGITSLESKRKLKEFDFIGFSLGYELSYTNVLNILDLGAIPLSASSRDASYPLVIGGGPCVLNPEPIHEFFDLFVIGEAEEAILEITDLYRKVKQQYKDSGLSKRELLVMLSAIEGVYVPSLYKVDYGPEGAIKEFKAETQGAPPKIKKRFVKDLDKSHFPLNWMVPYVQIVHDRISLELMRGCPNRCRFCQARVQYHPLRLRSAGTVLDYACSIYRNTGYEEISLLGLSVSDYPGIEEILKSLISTFKEKGVSVSLPSIKPRIILEQLSSLIATIKKTGLTFAPEAATDRLRKILAKDFDTEDFFNVIEKAYLAGYQHIKLYFMIGLPLENREDLEGIVEFANTASGLRKKLKLSAANVNVSVNTLIPKPHTPFQWLAMPGLEAMKEKQDCVRDKIRNRKLKVDFHNREMSFMEGVFSRGDRRLSGVIRDAFTRGARFDSWGNHFVFDRWMESFNRLGIDPAFYLKEKGRDELLPWDFIDTGISKEYLLQEADKIA
ncbi:MAG: TIGR03960 family B12-binding radical SAM protein [Candidatus Omnitrophica bacterium]|nr:TIGR03960 family B12-binding radical SAM protein [Candidatus Omnitrophota bacterium]